MMSSSSSMTDKNMPLEMWREILVRVPGESLIRSRAVCKGWRAVIEDPCFVRAHTNKQKQLSSSNIIIQNQTRGSEAVGSSYSFDFEALSCSNGCQAVAATPIDLDFDLWFSQGAACDGLFLTEKPALTIWNPLTHERLNLPGEFFSRNELLAFGLGYDGDDYKAVVILRNWQTHVYSLKLDTWRRIMNCPPCDWRIPLHPGVFVCGGGLNWLGAYDDKIVALDLGTEKYSLVQLPLVRNKSQYDDRRLFNYVLGGGCLALYNSGFGTHLDVWVMNKQLGSWNKLFSIDREPNISMWHFFLRPVAFIMKEEKLLVFLQHNNDEKFLFDVETKSLKLVEIVGSVTREDTFLYARQTFVGNMFRLRANCGCSGVRKIAPSTKKKASSFAQHVELVFRKRDITRKNDDHLVSCSKKPRLD